jgi:hypothetical protein
MFISWLASNHNPPDLCLPSSYDYRFQPLCPAGFTMSGYAAASVSQVVGLQACTTMPNTVFYLPLYRQVPSGS